MEERKCWEVLDVMSPQAKIYYEGKDNYKSIFGAIMSILTFICVFSLTGYFFYRFFSKDELNVVSSAGKDFIPYFDLNDAPILISLEDINGKKIDPKISKVLTKIWIGKNNTNTPIDIDVEQCDVEKHISIDKRYLYKEVNVSKYFCFKQSNNYSLYQDIKTGTYSYINMYLTECVNTTENGNHCLPKNKIQETLKGANFYFVYYFLSYAINHRNYSNPINVDLFFKRQKIYYEYYYVYNDYWKKTFYTSDNGNVFEELNQYEGIQYDSGESSTELRPPGQQTTVPGTYHVFKILINYNSADFYKRSYSKLQTLVANVGGVVKLCLVVADFITKYFSGKLFDLELMNKFFHFSKQTENEASFKDPNTVNAYTSKFVITTIPLAIKPNNKLKILNSQVNKTNKENFVTKSTSVKKALTTRNFLEMTICKTRSKDHDQFEECIYVIKKILSNDYLLELFNQFEKLKNILFDKDQKKVFENIKNFTLEESFLSLQEIKFPNNKFDECFNSIKSKNNEINDKLIAKFY